MDIAVDLRCSRFETSTFVLVAKLQLKCPFERRCIYRTFNSPQGVGIYGPVAAYYLTLIPSS